MASNSNLIWGHKEYYGKLLFSVEITALQICSNPMVKKWGIIFPSGRIWFMMHWEIVKLWITGISADLCDKQKKIIPILFSSSIRFQGRELDISLLKDLIFFQFQVYFQQIESKIVWFLFNHSLLKSPWICISQFSPYWCRRWLLTSSC